MVKDRVIGILIIGISSLVMGACSSSGDITDIAAQAKKSTLGQQTGLISGAAANYTSPQGYKVSSSVGAWPSSISQNSLGYTVFSSVQGSMASETPAQ